MRNQITIIQETCAVYHAVDETVHGIDMACKHDVAWCACSIWTVDLAYLLRRFGLEVELTTITIGANPAYAKESFYKEHMAEDGSRVERLFQVLVPTIQHLKQSAVQCKIHVTFKAGMRAFIFACLSTCVHVLRSASCHRKWHGA